MWITGDSYGLWTWLDGSDQVQVKGSKYLNADGDHEKYTQGNGNQYISPADEEEQVRFLWSVRADEGEEPKALLRLSAGEGEEPEDPEAEIAVYMEKGTDSWAHKVELVAGEAEGNVCVEVRLQVWNAEGGEDGEGAWDEQAYQEIDGAGGYR